MFLISSGRLPYARKIVIVKAWKLWVTKGTEGSILTSKIRGLFVGIEKDGTAWILIPFEKPNTIFFTVHLSAREDSIRGDQGWGQRVRLGCMRSSADCFGVGIFNNMDCFNIAINTQS